MYKDKETNERKPIVAEQVSKEPRQVNTMSKCNYQWRVLPSSGNAALQTLLNEQGSEGFYPHEFIYKEAKDQFIVVLCKTEFIEVPMPEEFPTGPEVFSEASAR